MGIYIVLFLAAAVFIYIILNIISVVSFSHVDQTVRSDAAIVLGAPPTADGEPSVMLKARVDHAVFLYNSGTVKKLIMTGGRSEHGTMPESVAAMKYAIKKGVRSEDILIDEMSHYTIDNMENAKEIMKKEELKTALIVSTPLHMKRAVMLAKFSGLDVKSSPSKEPGYKNPACKLKFLAREVFYYVGYKWYLPVFGSHTSKKNDR